MIGALVMGRRLLGLGDNFTVTESGIGGAFCRDCLGIGLTTLLLHIIRGACWMHGTIPGVLLRVNR